MIIPLICYNEFWQEGTGSGRNIEAKCVSPILKCMEALIFVESLEIEKNSKCN